MTHRFWSGWSRQTRRWSWRAKRRQSSRRGPIADLDRTKRIPMT